MCLERTPKVQVPLKGGTQEQESMWKEDPKGLSAPGEQRAYAPLCTYNAAACIRSRLLPKTNWQPRKASRAAPALFGILEAKENKG